MQVETALFIKKTTKESNISFLKGSEQQQIAFCAVEVEHFSFSSATVADSTVCNDSVADSTVCNDPVADPTVCNDPVADGMSSANPKAIVPSANPKAKRKLVLESDADKPVKKKKKEKIKKPSLFSRLWQGKRKLLNENMHLRRELKRSKKSKQKLKNELKAAKSAKKAAQEIIDGMAAMNPTAKMLFQNEVVNGQRLPAARTYKQEVKDFAFKISYYSNKAYDFLLSKKPGEDGLSLPSARSIRRYLLPVDCEPGHLLKVLDIIKENIEKKNMANASACYLTRCPLRKLFASTDNCNRTWALFS